VCFNAINLPEKNVWNVGDFMHLNYKLEEEEAVRLTEIHTLDG